MYSGGQSVLRHQQNATPLTNFLVEDGEWGSTVAVTSKGSGKTLTHSTNCAHRRVTAVCVAIRQRRFPTATREHRKDRAAPLQTRRTLLMPSRQR